jgi:hypothetical protein
MVIKKYSLVIQAQQLKIYQVLEQIARKYQTKDSVKAINQSV